MSIRLLYSKDINPLEIVFSGAVVFAGISRKFKMKVVKCMKTNSIVIEKSLIQQLEKKGIEVLMIPRLIKDLENFFSDNPSMSLFNANNRLHLLGWNEVRLDYHTFQLAKAYWENEDIACT